MYDPETIAPSPAATAPRRPLAQSAWWILGLAGIGALLLAYRLAPAPEPDPPARTVSQTQEAAADEAGSVSLAETAAKAAGGLLLVYGVGWALIRMRRRGLSFGSAAHDPEAFGPRLRLAETLSLGRQRVALHLVEVDGETLLLGSAMDQVCLLWSGAGDETSAFAPVAAPAAEKPAPAKSVVRPRPVVPAATASPPRREADWSRERTRLISALLDQDPGR